MTINQPKKQRCSNCGGELTFTPGTSHLTCPYCGSSQEISNQSHTEQFQEHDYLAYLQESQKQETQIAVTTTQCSGCHAHLTLSADTIAEQCPYCGTSIILSDTTTQNIIAPKGILPFKIRARKGREQYQKWVQSRWFAPNDFKRQATLHDTLSGVYLPYWTFDTNTITTYTGKRGTIHRREKSTSTSWRNVSGTISMLFDDILVVASDSLPHKYVDTLEPWDLENLVPFNRDYLRGFQAEQYQIDLPTAFTEAQGKIEKIITAKIKQDIGGDKQKITSQFTNYDAITFKHILLPLWSTAYRYKWNTYRTVINGRTGEVQGERPWSWAKLSIVALALLAIILFFGYNWV